MNNVSNTPSLFSTLKRVHEFLMQGSFIGTLPGRIQSYSQSDGAVVEALIMDSEVTADGTTSVKPFPLFTGVPVVFPGAGGAYIEWSPAPGDHVILMFGMRSHDLFLQTGSLVDPNDLRMHDASDAIALPVADFSFNKVRSADPQIVFTGTQIQAGGTASLALRDELAALKGVLDDLVTALTPGAVPLTGSALASAITAALTGRGISPTWPPGTGALRGG